MTTREGRRVQADRRAAAGGGTTARDHAGDGPEGQMAGLSRRFPPRAPGEDWPATGQRHGRVAGHPVGGQVPQVMQGPVGAERVVGPGEHPVGRVIAQLAERAAQRPPQRVVRPGRDQAVQLRLIQPQPHERVRGGRQLLQVPCPLADHGDQLLPRVGVPACHAEQL